MGKDATDSPERKLARLEEALWVMEAQAGSADAFARLVMRYEKPLLYYLRRFAPSGDAALDLHQEVWVDAFRGISSLQSPEAFRVWIYRIAHHKAARFVREEIGRKEMARALSEETANQPAMEEYSAIEDTQAVHRALQVLPAAERELLTLYYLRDLSLEEIAAVLECPVGTVKSRLYHARGALRRVIERNSHE